MVQFSLFFFLGFLVSWFCFLLLSHLSLASLLLQTSCLSIGKPPKGKITLDGGHVQWIKNNVNAEDKGTVRLNITTLDTQREYRLRLLAEHERGWVAALQKARKRREQNLDDWARSQ
jgi:hypothetical protein